MRKIMKQDEMERKEREKKRRLEEKINREAFTC